MKNSDWESVDRVMITESLTAGRAYAYAVDLCERSEHRFAGSPGDRAAVAYLQKTMNEIGLTEVRAEPFPIQAWERGKTELVMLSHGQRRLDALALACTPSAHVEGDLVDVGHGTEDEFAAAGNAVQGRIVLVRSDAPAWLRRGMYRGEKVLRAQTYGAAGIVIMNATYGLLTLTGSLGFGNSGVTMPAVSVSYETGEALRRRLQVDGTVQLQMDMEHVVRPDITHNVMGDLTGQAWPERYLIVGAHHDSHDLCVGARDNAGGVGIMLEIARLLHKSPIGVGRTIRFIGFGAEELGLLGAEAYAASHDAELDRLDLLLDLDCAGRPGPKDLCVNQWPSLRDLLKCITQDITDLGFTDAPCSTHMDHFQFFLRGVPTGTLASNNRSGIDPKDAYHHTAADTLDKLTAEDVQAEALRTARALIRLSWSWPWPATRRSRGEVRHMLKASGLLGNLAVEGRFPFGRKTDPATSA